MWLWQTNKGKERDIWPLFYFLRVCGFCGNRPKGEKTPVNYAPQGQPQKVSLHHLACALQGKIRAQAGSCHWRGTLSFPWRFNRNLSQAALRKKTLGCFSSWEKGLLKRDGSKCFQNGHIMFSSRGTYKKDSGINISWRNSSRALETQRLFLRNLLTCLHYARARTLPHLLQRAQWCINKGSLISWKMCAEIRF